MKKDTWKTIIQVVISVLTAALTALGTTSCMGHGDKVNKASPVGGAFSHACACTYLSSFSSFSSAGSASKSVMLFSTRMLYQEMSFLMSLS